jgi:hypothetical protein
MILPPHLLWELELENSKRIDLYVVHNLKEKNPIIIIIGAHNV